MADEKKHVKLFTGDKSHEEGCVVKCTTGYQETKKFGKKTLKHSYRYNGHIYLQGTACPCGCGKTEGSKKDVYNLDFTKKPLKDRIDNLGGREWEQVHGAKKGVLNLPKDPRKKADAWHITTGNNFKTAKLPYAHEYHHMVPWDALNNVFTDAQLKLLQTAQYNLNSGENMVILPQNEHYGLIMRLVIHPDNHPDYTARVLGRLRQIRDDVKNSSSTHRINKGNVSQVKNDIVDFEEKTAWPKIIKLGQGQRTVSRAVNQVTFT